jgi:hypothetical protein
VFPVKPKHSAAAARVKNFFVIHLKSHLKIARLISCRQIQNDNDNSRLRLMIRLNIAQTFRTAGLSRKPPEKQISRTPTQARQQLLAE